jgi:hypothetical protein
MWDGLGDEPMKERLESSVLVWDVSGLGSPV